MTGGGEAAAADTGQAAGGGDREVFLASWDRSVVQASGSHVRTQQHTASPAEVLHIGQDGNCCAEDSVRLRT